MPDITDTRDSCEFCGKLNSEHPKVGNFGEFILYTCEYTEINPPRSRHCISDAFTANMIDGRRYLVMWSAHMGHFIRWTWWFPCHNERIIGDEIKVGLLQ